MGTGMGTWKGMTEPMAELDVFISRAEYVEFLCAALASGYRIQSNKNLRSPEAEYCSSEADIRTAVDASQYAFLLEREDFSRYPVKLRSFERDGTVWWYPRAAEGGPAIETCHWAPYEKAGRRIVPCALLACPSSTIEPETRATERAGPALKAAFSELTAPLRKVCRRVKSARRSALVTPGIDELLASGWRLADPFESAAWSLSGDPARYLVPRSSARLPCPSR